MKHVITNVYVNKLPVTTSSKAVEAALEAAQVTFESSSSISSGSYPSNFQFPHFGKFLGVLGMSVELPTWRIKPMPMSTWNSMWQWKNQKPETMVHVHSTVAISKSQFIPKHWYLKVNFLVQKINNFLI